jgi:CRISPR-associated endonuclease/helicase Cas3
MRTLVEQAVENVSAWVSRLELTTRVHKMVGGEADWKWDIWPEDEAIIIGTQDILLSAALNRGYAMKRYRWPISFGLLNNDCVWVLDEVQLMGAGLPTSTQLAALREKLGIFGPCVSIWMSATFTPECLRSVDFAAVSGSLPMVMLTRDDIKDERLSIRLNAPKHLAQAPGSCSLPQGLAEFTRRKHRGGSQTLVVVNRVARARETYDFLKRIYGTSEDQPEIRLLHSRFRGWERRAWPEVLKSQIPATGRIIVATQVIEAGVDISSSVLITDLAPYSSMVQRFGRCNRDGKAEAAEIFWIDRPLVTKQAKHADADELTGAEQAEVALPYEADELALARGLLAGLTSASSPDLPSVPYAPLATHVLRKRDLVDLFDTTRDLSGYDVDVSRFVRSGQDRDVLVAWRDVGESGPPRKTPRPTQDELCPAPIGEFKAFLEGAKGKPKRIAWRWEQLDGSWQSIDSAGIDRLCPGMILVLDRLAGGYDSVRGWDPGDWSEVEAVGTRAEEEFEDQSDDPLAFRDYDQELTAHLREVRERAEAILDRLAGLGVEPFREALLRTAAAHDIGKAHPVFQKTLHAGDGRPVMLAKSKAKGRHERKYFRHELASALALLSSGASDLIAYLTASHHGKVRLSIRAVPGEAKPAQVNAKFARGIHEGDPLPAVDTKLGIATPDLMLDLGPMLLGDSGGGPSWLARMTRLRDDIGVFRLAYLEALIRAADERASADPKEVL